ncbi:hypothetical protein RHSIM_Rhsim13G0157100 [Rhododendron simsii]|uniref:CRIB domain-containing protein n=1 Tax=Rhododendron simsii TaxID=118357 RepID=A0A834FWP6_RHOSS|nr:hypothetical protein RHSIM_Rhsim13G0157100 [Rhododendron simsii]
MFAFAQFSQWRPKLKGSIRGSSTLPKSLGLDENLGSFLFAVVKEREMEIGYPTDVKHVAHIGWDGPSGSAPSWMNEFNVASDFTATSIGNITGTRGTSSAISTWSSQGLSLLFSSLLFHFLCLIHVLQSFNNKEFACVLIEKRLRFYRDLLMY